MQFTHDALFHHQEQEPSLFLVVLVTPWAISARGLPEGFSVEIGKSGEIDLVWSSTTGRPVRVGGGQYKFRKGSEKVLGNPKELGGKLVLPMSDRQHNLITTDGQDLQVWLSGRRHDGKDAANLAQSQSTTGNSTVTTPTVSVNPTAPGNRTTKRLWYNLKKGLNLNSTEFPVSIEVIGEVTQPTVLTSGVKHPLVLFLHGRHATCYKGGPSGSTGLDWPCPKGYDAIPSHKKGY